MLFVFLVLAAAESLLVVYVYSNPRNLVPVQLYT